MKLPLLAACCVLAWPADATAQRLRAHDADLLARVIAMADSRSLDTAVVDAALRSRSSFVRASVLLTLGQLGPAAARPRLPVLRAALASDTLASSRAAYALGLLRDTGSVAALSGALARNDAAAREAAWALGQIGEPARAVILERLARRRGTPAVVHVQLLLAAAKLRPVPVAEVVPHLASPNVSVAWAAAYAIARTRQAAGVRALLAVAARNDTSLRANPRKGVYIGSIAGHRVRAEAARGLARSAAGDSLADSAFSALTRLAKDPSPHVRINALRSLATYRDRAGAMMVDATRDADANVRIAAVQGLATAGRGAPWDLLWISDSGHMYRRSLTESALTNSVLPTGARMWTIAGDWRLRAAIAGAASNDTTRSLVDPVAFLADTDARVRAAALSAVAADSAGLERERRDFVLRSLGDSDVMVRATALDALARAPRAVELSLAADAYDRARSDPESDARVAAIAYLTAAARRDSAAVRRLVTSRSGGWRVPQDHYLRVAGGALPGLESWMAVPLDRRPLAHYQRVVREVVQPSLSGRAPRATIATVHGRIVIELAGAEAPLTVDNFAALARRSFYRLTRFHRVVPNFVVQDGDPRGDGSGGPGYSIRDELNPLRYERGVLGMALSGPDTGGSQYFITHSPQPHLDGGYTTFGRIVSGLGALDMIVQGDAVISVTIR